MSSQDPTADARWQDLMRSMDPVANLNALADVWRDAATSSERVVGSFINGTDTGSESGPTQRDVFVDFERSVDQMADAAKQFFAQLPFGAMASTAEQPKGATVAVLDGVGTTEIQLPAASGTGEPWATDLVGHDGQSIAAVRVTIRAAQHGNGSSGRACIVKVTTPDDLAAGVYHGQILLRDAPEFVLPLVVRAYPNE